MPPFGHNHTTQCNTLNNTPLYLLTPQQGAFCGVCSADSNGMSYHRSLGQCKPCEGSMLPAIAGLLVALTVLLMLLAALRTSRGRKLLSKLRERAKKQKDDGPMTKGAEVRENDAQPGMPSSEELADLDLSTSFFDRLMVKLRILISMIQVLSQIGVVYSIPFPSLYANLLRWTSLLELNFIDILPLGCVMTVGFHFSLLVRTLVLPALLSVALAAKVARAPAKVADFFNGLNFFVLFLIYPSTSAAIFATFQCEELSDGTRWLRADLSIDCSGDTHTLFRVYAGFMFSFTRSGRPSSTCSYFDATASASIS